MKAFQSLIQPILDAYPELALEDLPVGAPPKLDMGDLALPLFAAAKKLGMPPPKLASEIACNVDFGPLVTAREASGPYLNLRIDRSAATREVITTVLTSAERYGAPDVGQGRRVVLEHTSINPNASPHVGRARNAMIGDSIARLLRFAGYQVEVHYYVNDMGRQIGLLVLIADELQGLTFEQILDAYVQANARADADPEFAKAGYDLLAKMEERDPDTQRRFDSVVELCLQGQLDVLKRLGIKYDKFDHESRFIRDARLDQIVSELKRKGAFASDENGRLVVDLAALDYPHKEGRHFVLMRANGSSMYGYRDLAYNLDKEALGADINLVVLGEDHKLYQQQIELILSACGHLGPQVIYYSYILLRDGKMSTRQGNVVLLSDFLNMAEALAIRRVAEIRPETPTNEKQEIAKQIAVAAIRFAILRVNPNKNVIFDIDQAVAFTGDTGPYVQYCCARINSIFRKASLMVNFDSHQQMFDFPESTAEEWTVILRLADFPNTVRTAVHERSVAGIANYALELAHAFTAFYHACPVLEAESGRRAIARLHLCKATLQTLQNALGLLGIEAPERM